MTMHSAALARRRLGRRAFIEVLASSGAAGPLLPVAAVAAAAEAVCKMKMDLSCGRIGVQVSAAEELELAARYGFQAVDPRPDYLAGLSEAALQRLLGRMKELGLVFGAAGLPVDFRGAEPKFAAGMKRLPAFAHTLQRAGVKRVGTWIRPCHQELTYLQNFKRHVQRLRSVATVLGDHGLRFGLEYVGPKTAWSSRRFPFIHTMAEAKELIAAIDRSNVGLVLDSWHWYTAGESGADLLTLKNEDIVVVDLNDAPAGIERDEQIDSRRELPCATGVIDLATFLGSLKRIGYDGPVRAEPFNAALRRMPAQKAVAATADAMKRAFALVE